MKTLQLEKTSASFRRTARLARRGVLVLTEKGKPVFALVGVKDEMALEALALSRNKAFLGYLDAVSRRSQRQRTYSLEEMRQEFQLPARPGNQKSGRK